MHRLYDAKRVTLDGDGSGTVVLGPVPPGVVWCVERMVTTVVETAAIPRVDVYLGSAEARNRIDGSAIGAMNVSEPNKRLFPGEYLTVAWEGGPEGEAAEFAIFGVVENHGPV